MRGNQWWMLGLASFINLLTGCGGTSMNKSAEPATHFKWYSVATAPKDYPMEVISGTFFYRGRDVGDMIPSGGTLRQGWGKQSSAYVKGPEIPPLPDRVSVKFYSYAENKFYKADFALPYDDILAKFQEQSKQEPDLPYDTFLLGIAPGGAVAVWINGAKTIEVYFGQAEEIQLTPTQAFKVPFNDKADSDDYIEKALAEAVTPEQLADIKANGAPIGLWARYRKLYKWAPVYKDGKIATKLKMPVDFLNGESYWIPTHFSDEYVNTPKPLPLHLEFRAQVTKEESKYYVIDFDPIELMDAFEKLGANGEKVFIEFDPRIPVTDMKIRVYNDSKPKDKKMPEDYIELKKFKVDP